MPQGVTAASSQKIRERTKDSRLKGSDLYVARLCWKETNNDQVLHGIEPPETSNPPDPTDDTDSSSSSSLTGSLHEELRFCNLKVKKEVDQGQQPLSKTPMATQSRPCYRCISYMHSAGIKRVFWTNSKGEWEGQKVQELVDFLESSGEGPSGIKTLFVTKHEVLMLRRTMGS